jgi:hypothetical protein
MRRIVDGRFSIVDGKSQKWERDRCVVSLASLPNTCLEPEPLPLYNATVHFYACLRAAIQKGKTTMTDTKLELSIEYCVQ